MPSIFCLQDDQDQVRHRTESCSVWFPLWLIVCGDKILLCTFDLVWTLLLFVPEKASSPFHRPQWSYQQYVWWHLFLVPGNHPTCSSVILSFSKRFLFAICRAQQCAGCKSIWERFVWNPLQASTVEHSRITLAYDSYLSSIGLSWDMWYNGRRYLNIASHLSIDLTTNEVYSGSLEADMSENHPSCSSVKWEVLPLFCLKVSWMQFAGHSHVQVASVFGKACLKPFTSKYCGTFMNHPGSWFLPQQHWSVPRHMTLWQKMLVTLPATFPLTVLKIREEYSGKRGIFRQSWSRLSREL